MLSRTIFLQPRGVAARSRIPGAYRYLAIPVPIPNTVVKQVPPMIVLSAKVGQCRVFLAPCSPRLWGASFLAPGSPSLGPRPGPAGTASSDTLAIIDPQRARDCGAGGGSESAPSTRTSLATPGPWATRAIRATGASRASRPTQAVETVGIPGTAGTAGMIGAARERRAPACPGAREASSSEPPNVNPAPRSATPIRS